MKRLLLAVLLVASPALAQTPAQTPGQTPPAPPAAANDAGKPAAQQTQARALIVLNARGARLAGQTLVLEEPMPSAIVFTDRPVRAAGHLPTAKVVAKWSPGKSFAKDPPNASVSVFAKDGSSITDAVVVLKDPKVDGNRLTFTVSVLEGDLANADGPASIFIDTIWFGVGSEGVHYLGQNRTNGGISPNVGDPGTAFQGWSNPSPDGSDRQSSAAPSYGLTAPPELRGGGAGGALAFQLTAARSNLRHCAAMDDTLSRSYTITPLGESASIRSTGGINDMLMQIEPRVYKSNIQLGDTMVLVVADTSRTPATLEVTERALGCRWSAVAK